MKDRHFVLTVTSFLILSFACGQSFTRVEIDVSKAVKKAIETAAPSGKYRFCALKESFPKNIEDMNQSSLFVCGEIESQVGQTVVMASLGDTSPLLFRSIRRFFMNPNVLSGKVSMTVMTSVKPDRGEAISILTNNTTYGRDHSFDSVLDECLQEMKKSKNSVLLLEREKTVESSVLSEMVEVVFR